MTRQRRKAESRPEPLPDVRVAPYRSRSCRATPLVQPKPSCITKERERRHLKPSIGREAYKRKAKGRPNMFQRKVGVLLASYLHIIFPPSTRFAFLAHVVL